MTSSYSGSSQPSVNSEGELVWKPAVGLHFKPSQDKAESYGGVIGAIQDNIVLSAQKRGSAVTYKDYPESFAGIISALQDLGVAEDKPGSDADIKPPGSEIIVDPETGEEEEIVVVPPQDGDLWFDTRQGRLLVAVDQEWYQANGADGIAYVTDRQPVGNIVIGQFWWNPVSNELYVFDGLWEEPSTGQLSAYSDELANPVHVWKLVSGTGADLQTTATLPLAVTGVSTMAASANSSNLPDIDVNDFHNQRDYNEWLMSALLSLESSVDDISNEDSKVHLGINPPAYPEKGALWYDTEGLELSVYYEQPDGVCIWVPTASTYQLNQELAAVSAALTQETQTRELRLAEQLQLLNVQTSNISNAVTQLNTLQQTVDGIQVPSITGLASESYVSNAVAAVQTAVDGITVPSLSGYATESYVTQELAPLIQAEATHATKDELEELRSQIPSSDALDAAYATNTSVDQKLAGFNNTYLPRAGGSMTGGFVWDTPFDGQEILKLATYSPDRDIDATFGITNNYFELAWNFTSNEDFCWVHNGHKVFSISNDGPACEELYLGTFSPNNNGGRVLSNRIGVRSKLDAHQLGFQRIVSAAQSANTFDEFKGYLINTLSGF